MKKNQGFSLVELIVVVAIMAILIGVLAPAYLRYVEKSRKSTDVSAIDEMIGAADKVAVDPELSVPANAKFTISINGGSVSISYSTSATSTATDASVVTTEWKALANMKGDGYAIKSSAWSTGTGSFVGKVGADGDVTWSHSGDVANDMCSFSSSLSKKASSAS